MGNVFTFPGSDRPSNPATSIPVAERYFRHRDDITGAIQDHIDARAAYCRAVIYETALVDGNLTGKVEQAREDAARAYEVMQDKARHLVIVMPSDLKGLIELMMYMERNFSSFPIDVHRCGPGTEPLALQLVKTVRLSLRRIAKHGKYAGSRDD